MRMLLDGLDSPTRTKHSAPKENHADNDLSVLLDGAENWDWTDMEADFMTPKKKTVSPNKAFFHPQSNGRQRSPHKRHRSPVKPPVTPRRTCSTPSGAVSKHDLNLSMSDLLDGAETWDWQDMESDFLSPRKRDKPKVWCTMLHSPLFLTQISVWHRSRGSLYQGSFRSLYRGSSGRRHAAWFKGQILSSFATVFSTLRAGLVGENSTAWTPTFSHTPG